MTSKAFDIKDRKAVDLSRLTPIDHKIPDETLTKLSAKGFTNVSILKSPDHEKPVFKYDSFEGLVTFYMYPDGQYYAILNDDKLKDEELRKKYINEPLSVETGQSPEAVSTE